MLNGLFLCHGQVAMPRHNALDMASKIASGARQLAQVPGGQQTLVELLQLHGHDHETAVALRDIAAGIAFSVQVGHSDPWSLESGCWRLWH